jgi:hypothetical protein
MAIKKNLGTPKGTAALADFLTDSREFPFMGEKYTPKELPSFYDEPESHDIDSEDENSGAESFTLATNNPSRAPQHFRSVASTHTTLIPGSRPLHPTLHIPFSIVQLHNIHITLVKARQALLHLKEA